jgi:predicted O-methyltransferase YrrM
VTIRPYSEALKFVEEGLHDQHLRQHIADMAQGPDYRHLSDPAYRPGRRLGWYALARITKPKLIVETGVDKGLGAVLLCAALQRNACEGLPGRYIGIDIDNGAGRFLTDRYREFGSIIYSDAREALHSMTESIDLLITDSDHAPRYESSEYEAAARLLTDSSIIISDESQWNDTLMKFAERTGRRFLQYTETPKDHWGHADGIGFCFK